MFHPIAARTHRKPMRYALLAGTSLIAMVVSVDGAMARALNGSAGGGAVSAPNIASDAAVQAAQNAAAAARQTQQSLARAAKAVQDMQSIQAAARTAAAAAQVSSTAPVAVPNGLGAGGLLTNMPAGWSGANAPTQSVDGSGQTQVNIRQTTQQAILNWQSFNVGGRTTLTFDQQGNASWVALNRVNNATAPSQILGTIKADGQVYVVNQSGIIFGGNAQVNVGSLIASTAGITDSQFFTNGIFSVQSGANYTPSFTAAGGRVVVERGASIQTHAPSQVTSGGGTVLMLGSAVDNAGSIAAPKGQVLLAAGDDFSLRRGYSTDNNQAATTRGIELLPQIAAGSASGNVGNSGLLFAQQGDVTLAGRVIAQDGVIIATTSVNTRGTIHLLNSAADGNGSVILGSASLTAILPELDSSETALNSQRDALITASAAANTLRAQNGVGRFDNLSLLADRQDQSRIEIVTGGNVTFKGGSTTAAQGGQIAVSAGQRIFTEDGATLDVSGVRNVALAMASNNLKINIQGNELRDSPLNRDSSALKSNDVWIDIRSLTLLPAGTGGYASDRYYTSGGLLEVGGYLNTTPHTIGEWSALGGSITLQAPEVIVQRGSVFDISGGSLDVAGGWMRSTNLIGSDGRRYSVDDASADMKFAGFAGGFRREHQVQGRTDERLTEIWTSIFDRGRTSLRWEDGYTVGRDAGRLILSAPTSIFEGTMIADVVKGKRQTGAPVAALDGYKATQTTAALAGTLALGAYTANGRVGGADADVKIGDIADITVGMSADDVLPADRRNTAWFDARQLSSHHLGGLSLASTKSIAVTADVTLAQSGGFELIAPVIDIGAQITARGGAVTLTNILVASNGTYVLSPASGRPVITLQSDAVIDTRGMWSNLSLDRDGELLPVDGGDVTIRSSGDVVMKAGALIDASSGAAILADGKFKGGKGGNIALSASYETTGIVGGNHGDLSFDGTVRSNGVTRGGALTLETGGAIVIGGLTYSQGATLPAGTAAPYDLTLTASLTIPAGTALPLAASLSLTSLPGGMALPESLWYVFQYYGFKANGTSWAQTQAAWTNVPTNMTYVPNADGSGPQTAVARGDTIPAGVYITYGNPYAATSGVPFVVPASVFPNGVFLVGATVPVSFAAGAIAPADVTFAAGVVITKGTVLGSAIAVRPIAASSLSSDLFQSGFSAYTINGGSDLSIAGGAQIAAAMPVYRPSETARSVATGADPSAALELYLPPTYLENPFKGTLTQRAGADITLMSSSTAGSVSIARGASVSVDPGAKITLSSGGSIDVEGTVTAHGGSIALVETYLKFDANGNVPIVSNSGAGKRSMWIGDSAVLDVSAVAVTAIDAAGRSYGVVPDGGNIAFGRAAAGDYAAIGLTRAADSFIVIRPGALLDASGTSATVDLAAGLRAGSSDPIALASNGGSITLASYDGILVEGRLRAAAGGARAAGGILNLMLETPYYANFGAYPATLPLNYQVGRVLNIGQSIVPGALPAGVDLSHAAFVPGQAGISADRINAGGFGTVSLGARNAIVFDGDVALSAGRAITLASSAFYDTKTSGKVNLAAPYVMLGGLPLANKLPQYSAMPSALTSVPTVIGAQFNVAADLIDVRNDVTSRFADTGLTSRGDLRFLAGAFADPAAVATTSLLASGNITLTAQQVYPDSGAVVFVRAGYDAATPTSFRPGATLTLASVDGATPAMPYSVFGSITLEAPIVRQGGVLRAPLGAISLGLNPRVITDANTSTVLLPGSITSVSAAGLVMPYGGTTDGVTYTVNGGAPITVDLLTGELKRGAYILSRGVTLNGTNVTGEAGSKLDLSGGGTLLGAGFISGRGGSVDVLTTAFANANPGNNFSAAGNQVYAIVPGTAVAPTAGGAAAAWTGNVPQVGQTVTIPAGVPGLPAGTYTLLPANYALLPGAYRIELGATNLAAAARSGTMALPNGSYLTTGRQGVAHTAIQNALSTVLTITPGAVTRSYSQYNEQGYAAFQTANAATFNALRPMLEADGAWLSIKLSSLIAGTTSGDSAFVFRGTADFAPAADGFGGNVAIATTNRSPSAFQSANAPNELVLSAPGSTTLRTATRTTVSADTIEALGAPNLYLGAAPTRVVGGLPTLTFAAGSYFLAGSFYNPVTLESGATLRAARVVLSGGKITIGDGALIDTTGRTGQAPDTAASGFSLGAAPNAALLAVSNGHVVLAGASSGTAGDILIGNGAGLYSDGTIGLVASNSVSFIGTPRLGAAELALSLPSINIGSAAALGAAGTLPIGLSLNQDVLNLLLTGNAAAGVPAVRTISLTASNSVNFYGSVDLDFTTAGHGVGSLVLNTPAIYGAGAAGDIAQLKVDTLVWNGVLAETGYDSSGNRLYGSAKPGAVVAGGPGTGAGLLNVDARTIVLGYAASDNPDTTATLDRLTLGFGTVAFNASDRITANSKGSLSVFASGPSPDSSFDARTYAGIGGTLNLVTPLLTGDPAAILSLRAGAAVNLAQPASAAPSSTPAGLGAAIDITSGGTVHLDGAVYLPTGKFAVTAAGDITLGSHARLDLSGQALSMIDITRYSWGGDVALESTHGSITQAAGSLIDISATGNNAGTLKLTATDAAAGRVLLGGTLNATRGDGRHGGSIDIRAQLIGADAAGLSADFAALNTRLSASGFTEGRSFVLKQGNLVIGNELAAHAISVSVDAGSLTVNGKVDASGTRVGAIMLSSRDDLTLASSAVLDAHGTVLSTDSKGVAIAANNAADIELTTRTGTLRLDAGATLDLRAADNVARGRLVLNAPRLGNNGGSATGNGAPSNATGNDIAVVAAGPLDIRGARSVALNGVANYTNAPYQAGSTTTQVITQAWLDLIDQDSTAFVNSALANAALQARIAGLSAYGSAFHLQPGVEITSATPTGDLVTSGDIDLSGYRYGPNADRNAASPTYGAGEAMDLVVRAGGNLTINGSVSDGFKPQPTTPPVIGLIPDIATDNVNFVELVADLTFRQLIDGRTVTLTRDWIVPGLGSSSRNKRPLDLAGTAYAVGSTVPAGTVLSRLYVPVSELAAVAGLFAAVVSPGVAGYAGTSPIAKPVAGATSASIRLVAGADLDAAATRTLRAASTLAGSGNILLSDYHSSNGFSPDASTLRTGAGQLDLLAGGNFAQDSIFNVSTNGSEAAPADLFIAVQGTLTGSISFGSSTVANWLAGNRGTTLVTDGFTGLGAIGGGRVTIRVGGDAGELTAPTPANNGGYASTGLVVAARAGDVSIAIGGRLNPGGSTMSSPFRTSPDTNGVFTALRGDLDINAGAIGVIPLIYGRNGINDPRGIDRATASQIGNGDAYGPQGAITVVAGDGTIGLDTRGDLALGQVGAAATVAYWTDRTAIDLFAAGGNLVPITDIGMYGGGNSAPAQTLGSSPRTVGVVLPPIFTAVAGSGSIYYGGAQDTASVFRLKPSAYGRLELVARDSIYGAALGSGGGMPYMPGRFEMETDASGALHNGNFDPIRVYAVNGDIVNVALGESYTYQLSFGGVSFTTRVAAKAARVIAGRDMVNFGRIETVRGNSVIAPSLILNTNDTDVSVIRAGRNMYYTNVEIAGPGALAVTAGGNLYQAAQGGITSIGAIATGDTRPGADLFVAAGIGAGPDYAGLAAAYLDPANALTEGAILAGSGKVAKTYEADLLAWLTQRFSARANYTSNGKSYVFTGGADNALAFFNSLPVEQQGLFARQVYYAELTAGGREYNDKTSSRYGSYLRGREAIAALFPDTDASGNAIARSGGITMFGGSGVRTLFGGDVQLLAPAGQVVIGVEGQAPPATSGLTTQGSGDIQIYSKGSILLGLSRIMTTFGGNILAWSAEGDINAGRGAKTTVVYTPPRRVTDNYGNVTLAPVVPSSGAGIATLNPIPDVPAGDIDLIAPLGTIDAGEAGIRSSGNANLAALQILNAANIQVQGSATGVPVVQAPNIAAALSSANTAAATQQNSTPNQGAGTVQPSVIIVEVLGYGGGDTPQQEEKPNDRRKDQKQSYDPNSMFQIVGSGRLTPEQKSKLTDEERAKMSIE